MVSSLTGWLEGILSPIASKSGLPSDRVASTIGGQLIGTVLGDIYDKTTEGWFNTFLHLATGLGAIAYTMYGKASPRLKEDLLEIGTIELMRLLQPKYWQGFKESLKAWLSAVRSGDYKSALSLMFKTQPKLVAPAPAPAPAKPMAGGAVQTATVTVKPAPSPAASTVIL